MGDCEDAVGGDLGARPKGAKPPPGRRGVVTQFVVLQDRSHALTYLLRAG